MKITNKHNIPDVLVRALSNDSYNRGDCDFTVTELLKPPRQWALQNIYKHEIEEDASDLLYRLYGQIGHGIIEKSGSKDEITERRYYAKYGEYKVSAQLDSLTLLSGRLTDWKFTTSYKFIAGKPRPHEWMWQLNIQADILRKNGVNVQSAEICGLLRDWQIGKSKADKSYPQTSICLMPIELMQSSVVEEFIKERITLFEESLKKEHMCTQEDTWNGKRCESYCNVSFACTQYRQTKERKDGSKKK